jgi:hypothetical protein
MNASFLIAIERPSGCIGRSVAVADGFSDHNFGTYIGREPGERARMAGSVHKFSDETVSKQQKA